MKQEETSAGQQLRSKVIEEQNRARNKLRDAQNHLEQALGDRDNTAANEILELHAKHDATIQIKDLYHQTLDSLAAAGEENTRLRKEAEEDVAAMERRFEAASGQL